MNYKIKSGYTLIKVCDTHLIVAKRSRWENQSRILPISKKYAVCWTLMENGKTSDEMIQSMADLFHKPLDEVSKRFSPIITKLANGGYLEEVEAPDR